MNPRIELTDYVSRETISKMESYLQLLLKWQKAVNIVSQSTLDDAWNRHFLDSIQVVDLCDRTEGCWVDLGCGGGFPGLVVAQALPEMDVYLVESDSKKCSFMRTVSRETKTPTQIINQRIESFMASDDRPRADVISARALASLDKLLDYCLPIILDNPDVVCLFQKGAQFHGEIDVARQGYEFDCDVIPSAIDPLSVVLKLSKVRKL